MGLRSILFRQILLLGIAFYGLPIMWWQYNGMDNKKDDDMETQENDYYLSIRFLMSTGLLMVSMSMSYVSLPLDIIPDWIPIFGKIDDLFAKMICGAGCMMCYMGYKFGTGDVPREFQTVIFVVQTVYNVVSPIVQKHIIPLIIPALKAISKPMKVLANVILQKVGNVNLGPEL